MSLFFWGGEGRLNYKVLLFFNTFTLISCSSGTTKGKSIHFLKVSYFTMPYELTKNEYFLSSFSGGG